MAAYPPALLRLINNLSRLPGIGEKTATRLALQVLRWPREEARELAESIARLHERVSLCSYCLNFTEDDPCPICTDTSRDRELLCVVEDSAALEALEKAGVFKGRYHVLHGLLSPRDGIGPKELRVKELLGRIPKEGIKEVILALSPTAPGEATAAYLRDVLVGLGVRVSRIACGVPMGMEIKYADEMTLRLALEGRRDLGA
ncbi:recombination mediator RecR [Thermosulfuriphilus sp.]